MAINSSYVYATVLFTAISERIFIDDYVSINHVVYYISKLLFTFTAFFVGWIYSEKASLYVLAYVLIAIPLTVLPLFSHAYYLSYIGYSLVLLTYSYIPASLKDKDAKKLPNLLNSYLLAYFVEFVLWNKLLPTLGINLIPLMLVNVQTVRLELTFIPLELIPWLLIILIVKAKKINDTYKHYYRLAILRLNIFSFVAMPITSYSWEGGIWMSILFWMFYFSAIIIMSIRQSYPTLLLSSSSIVGVLASYFYLYSIDALLEMFMITSVLFFVLNLKTYVKTVLYSLSDVKSIITSIYRYVKHSHDGKYPVSYLLEQILKDGKVDVALEDRDRFRHLTNLIKGRYLHLIPRTGLIDVKHVAKVIRLKEPYLRNLLRFCSENNMLQGWFSKDGRFFVTAKWLEQKVSETLARDGKVDLSEMEELAILDTSVVRALVSAVASKEKIEGVWATDGSKYFTKGYIERMIKSMLDHRKSWQLS